MFISLTNAHKISFEKSGYLAVEYTWASEPSASITLFKKVIGIQMTETRANIQPTPMAQDGYLYSNVFLL